MTTIFGPNTERVLRFLTLLPDLSTPQIDLIASTWKQVSSRERAEAWVRMHRVTTTPERYHVRAASSVARRMALDAASSLPRPDWAFWAAVSDAAGAIAVGDRIGPHYDTLIAPLAGVMPFLTSSQDDLKPVKNAERAVRQSV